LLGRGTAAIETHLRDLLFDPRGTSFIKKISLKTITRRVGVLALIALSAGCSLVAFDEVVTVTLGTQLGHEYYDALLLKQSAARHT
jgi:hypothetical protein